MLSLESLFGEEAGVLHDPDFQLLLLVGVILPFGNGPLSPILDSLVGPLGASVGTIGLLVSVFLAPSIVVIPTVGVLADRHGRKPLLTPSLVLFGLPGGLIALTTEFQLVLGLRFLQGVGWAGLTALVVTSIGDLYSGPKETTAQGLRQMTSGLSGALISVIAGTLVAFQWQLPFILYFLAVPVAIAVYVWFDDPVAESDGDRKQSGDVTYRKGLVNLLKQRRVLAISLAGMLPIVGYFGFLTYNSVIVVRILDGTPAQSGLLFAAMTAVFAVVASQAGRLTTVVGGRYGTLVGAHAVLGGGLVVVFTAPAIPVVGLGSVLIGIGAGLALPIYRSLITSFASVSHRGGLVGVNATGSRILGTLTPIAMGGVIAYLTPMIGFSESIQWTGIATAAFVGGGGILCVLAAISASPVRVSG